MFLWLAVVSYPAAGALAAAPISWTNSSGGNWSLAVNWSPNQVPGPADDAVITLAGSYTVLLDANATLSSLTLGGAAWLQTLTNAGHTLTVTNSSLIGSNGVFAMGGGSWGGGGLLTVAGQFNWTGGVSAGPLMVASNGVLTIAGSGTVYVGGALTNDGTVNWTGTAVVEVDYGSIYTGFIENLAGGTWNIASSQPLNTGYGGKFYFHNAGTVVKSGTNGTTTINLPFYNSGTVSALDGAIIFENGGVIGGGFSAATGAVIDFDLGSFTSGGASLAGPGTNEFTGGNLTLTNDSLPDLLLGGGKLFLAPGFQGGAITNLTLAGMILQGTNTVAGVLNCGDGFSGSLFVAPGATMNWSGGMSVGPLTVASNGVLNIGGTGEIFVGGPLTNAGTVNWTGLAKIEVDYGSIYTGFIENLAGGLWNIVSDQPINTGYGGQYYFRNAGMVMKHGTTGTTTINLPFYESGTVTNLGGTIIFENGGTIAGGFYADAGAVISFGGGNYTATGTPLSGPGLFEITGGNLTLANDVIPNLLFAGGDLFLPAGFQGGTITNLTLSGMLLEGTNTVTGVFNCGNGFNGSLLVAPGAMMNWTGGMSTGPLTVASNAVLNITGNGAVNVGQPLTNAGTVNWTGNAGIEVDNGSGFGGLIENLPGGVWNIDSERPMNIGYGGKYYFHNAGLVRKAGDVWTTVVQVPFWNSGLLEVDAGNLYLKGGLALTNGVLQFGLGSATSFGSINISGNVALEGGLTANWLGGYVPALGDSFALVSYGSHSGVFTSLNLPAQAAWQTNYGSGAFSVTVSNINRLVFTRPPQGAGAGDFLAPVVVQLEDSGGRPIPQSGVPVSLSIASGDGRLSGTVSQATASDGTVTFSDLSINLAGVKTIEVSAPGVVLASGLAVSPATSGSFTITPAAPAQLFILTPISSPQVSGMPFSPFPAVQIQDPYGNVISNTTAFVTANVASGDGALGGQTSWYSPFRSGSVIFTNLFYLLANPARAESAVVYFTSPGLVPATNPAVEVAFAATNLVLVDGNSVVKIDPTTEQGIYSWTVDGTNELYQSWFWLAVGSNPAPFSIDKLGPALGLNYSASNASVNYLGEGLSIILGFTLRGGAAGSAASGMTESLNVLNTTNKTAVLRFFSYADFDLAGVSAGDALELSTNGVFTQTGKGMVLTGAVASPAPDYWEGSWYDITWTKLGGNSPVTLSDTFIPEGKGDQTFALQWDFTLSPGAGIEIDLTQTIYPAAIVLRAALQGSTLTVSWPASGGSGFHLEAAGSLGAEVDWAPVTNAPVLVGDRYEVSFPAPTGARLYRLKQ